MGHTWTPVPLLSRKVGEDLFSKLWPWPKDVDHRTGEIQSTRLAGLRCDMFKSNNEPGAERMIRGFATRLPVVITGLLSELEVVGPCQGVLQAPDLR